MIFIILLTFLKLLSIAENFLRKKFGREFVQKKNWIFSKKIQNKKIGNFRKKFKVLGTKRERREIITDLRSGGHREYVKKN